MSVQIRRKEYGVNLRTPIQMAETEEEEETQVMTSKKADIIYRRKRSNRIEESKKLEGSKSSKKAEDIESMTLAEIQMLTKKKRKLLKLKETEMKSNASRPKRRKLGNLEIKRNGKFSNDNDLNIIAVEDSDFYDFDRDREEKSFKKGQVWALYDDDDGMPRLYCLIAEIASVKPFEVKINWLDLHNNNNNGDQLLISWEKTMGIHISCGRFKLGKNDSLYSLNIFSHIINAERVARELYWIYPEKGSIWALYNNKDSLGNGNKRCYEIILLLTSYSEIYGLSFGYLEKVDGFKTVFKRKEMGGNAIKWVEKGDFQLFSHEIPARKLAESNSEVPKDCWELDPASLPPEFLSLSWKK